MKSINHYLYFVYYSLAVFLDMINTKQVFLVNKLEHFTFKQEIGISYMLILNKILLLFGVANYSSFYFNKNVNKLIQLAVWKFISMIIWLFIHYKVGFTTYSIIYFVLNCLYLVSLRILYRDFSHFAYHNYNMRIGTDSDVISAYICSEIITAIKSTTLICVVLLIFYDFCVGRFSPLSLFAYLKGAVLLFDRILEQNKAERYLYYRISPVLIGTLMIVNGIVIFYKAMLNGLLQEPVGVFNELLLIAIFILQLYYLMLTKRSLVV